MATTAQYLESIIKSAGILKIQFEENPRQRMESTDAQMLKDMDNDMDDLCEAYVPKNTHEN